MGIFDRFKPKKKTSNPKDEAFKILYKIAFSGGESQEIKEANIVCEMYQELYNTNYNFEDIKKFNRFANTRFILRNFNDDFVLRESLLNKNVIDEEDLSAYIAYLTAKYENAKIPKKLSQLMEQISVNENIERIKNSDDRVEEFKKQNAEIANSATGSITEVFGDFGYDKSNPIHAPDLMASMFYMQMLKLESGENINCKRTKGVTASNVNDIIDEYAVYKQTGEFITNLYISPYQKELSKIAPKGFRLG